MDGRTLFQVVRDSHGMRSTRRTPLAILGGAATPLVSGLGGVEGELGNVHGERAVEPLAATSAAALGGDR